MIGEQRIELIFFDGCPNVSSARDNLRSALQWEGKDTTWTEWDLFADSTPKRLRQHGSPLSYLAPAGSNLTTALG